MDTKTQELPLLNLKVADAAQTTRVPLGALPPPGDEATLIPVGEASERVTRPLALVPDRVAPAASAMPPPLQALRPAPGQPEREPVREHPIAAAPVPAPRARRRWPLALGSWVGGIVAGMLILTLALGLFGKPRDLAARTGDPTAAWDTSITLTDAYLTAQARKNGTGQVQEPVLHVQADGKVALQGKVSLLGRTVPMSATVQPSLVAGKLQMDVVQLQVGGLPLPEAVVKQIAGGVAGAMQPPAGALETTIVRLEPSDGKLVLYSKLK